VIDDKVPSWRYQSIHQLDKARNLESTLSAVAIRVAASRRGPWIIIYLAQVSFFLPLAVCLATKKQRTEITIAAIPARRRSGFPVQSRARAFFVGTEA
jgi:hypothetical protein